MLQLRNITYICLLTWAMVPPVFGQGHFPMEKGYENASLPDIIKEWEQKFSLVFTYNPKDMNKVVINTQIDANNLEEAIEQLFSSCPVDIKWVSNSRILLRYNSNWTKPWRLLALSGRVRDQHTGQSLSYASLFIPGSRFGTTADKNGSFFLQVPDTLEAEKLICRYLGYKARSIPLVSIKSFLDIGMVQDENSLPVIEIEELGKELVSPLETGKYSMRNGMGTSLPALTQQNPLQLIQYLPGVNARTENLSELSVRGGQRDENLIMLDEIPLFHVDHYLGIFSIFNADAVSGFDFYQTDFPIEYGGRTSSILAINGKDPNLEKAELKLGADLFSVNSTLNIPLGKKVGILLSARGSNSELGEEFSQNQDEGEAINRILEQNIPDSIERKIANVPLPTFRFFDLYGKVFIQSSQKARIELTAFKSNDHLNFLGDEGPMGRLSKQYAPKKQRDSVGMRQPEGIELTRHETGWANQGLSLAHIQNWARGSYSKTYAFSSSFDRFFDFQVFKPMHPQFFRFRDENSINYVGIGHHTKLTQGLNALEMGLSLKRIQANYDLETDRAGTPRDTIYKQDEMSGILNLYAAYSFWIQERLKIKVGWRGTYLQNIDQWLNSPRFSASYLVNEQLVLKAAIGRYNQYIREIYQLSPYSTSEAFWALADGKGIVANSSTHVSLGANLKAGRFTFNVEAYYKDLEGLINKTIIADVGPNGVPISTPRFFQGKGFSMGIDATLQLNLEKYQGWLSYSLGKVTHQFDDLNKGEPFSPQEDQRHQLKWGNNYSIGKLDFSMAYIYGSGKPYLVWNSRISQAIADDKLEDTQLPLERLPDYHRIDIGATYRFNLVGKKRKNPASVGFSVFNLTNRNNVAFKQFVISPTGNSGFNSLRDANVVGSEVPSLGITPNVSFSVSF